MNKNHLAALQYIQNTNGHATLDHFLEDHEPIGNAVWNQLCDQRLAYIDSDQIVRLTESGEQALMRQADCGLKQK